MSSNESNRAASRIKESLMSFRLAIAFTNFGPYHLARLRALARSLADRGGELVAHEVAGDERKYPWTIERGSEPFRWVTLFPDRALESLTAGQCRAAMRAALNRDRPEVVVTCGYSRPESQAALNWAKHRGKPAVLMSESQELDHPRTAWKEWLKRQWVSRYDCALAGGPPHRDYLVKLGIPVDRIALGYNVVDNLDFVRGAGEARADPTTRVRLNIPPRPYFLCVSRFATDKNLMTLIRCHAAHFRQVGPERAWDLVLCGSGTPEGEAEVRRALEALPNEIAARIHLPGFVQGRTLQAWYAHASAFVLASTLEPWGLVVNEAAACGLPLLVSNRVGAASVLVRPDVTGRVFDPYDEMGLTEALVWLTQMEEPFRASLGRNAAALASQWGPERFAQGTLEALDAVGFPARSRVCVKAGSVLDSRPSAHFPTTIGSTAPRTLIQERSA